MVCMADIICATHLYLSQLCARIFIYLHITPKKNIKTSHSWDDSKHLIWDFHQKNTYLKQPAASRNCWLSTWVSKLHACRLGYVTVCVCIEKLHTYTCRSVLLTIYASIKSWRVMQPIFGSATKTLPREMLRHKSMAESLGHSRAGQWLFSGYSAPKYEATKRPVWFGF